MAAKFTVLLALTALCAASLVAMQLVNITDDDCTSEQYVNMITRLIKALGLGEYTEEFLENDGACKVLGCFFHATDVHSLKDLRELDVAELDKFNVVTIVVGCLGKSSIRITKEIYDDANLEKAVNVVRDYISMTRPSDE